MYCLAHKMYRNGDVEYRVVSAALSCTYEEYFNELGRMVKSSPGKIRKGLLITCSDSREFDNYQVEFYETKEAAEAVGESYLKPEQVYGRR